MAGWVGSLQRQLDSWQRLHSQWSQWPPWNFNWKWPWQDRENTRRQARRLKEESEHRKEQVEFLCRTVKVENLADLQDLLGAMVLSECVYKQPDHELVRAVNKFKADFGGQLVSVDRIQASLDHVPHRYLLAEGRDTLFASFVGTNHYKDVMADANVLQGALFHEEDLGLLPGEDDVESSSSVKGLGAESQLGKSRQQRIGPKPAAHRGFLGRAKGIPAVEIYQLARQKDKKLVLCGHSLGGAVAVLTTLAILRVFSGSSKPNVKCITFSQPPVGNRALRDYVHRSGWQQHFQTYCIPEDVVPRILSPAYFQHYHEGGIESKAAQDELSTKTSNKTRTANGTEPMALGLGPVQTSIWRLSRLVPLVSGQQWLKGKRVDGRSSAASPSTNMKPGVSAGLVEPFEIQENTEGVSLVPLPPVEDSPQNEEKPASSKQSEWRKRVLALPSYIPFGQLFLLEKAAVQPLSASEYTRLTSVQSVLMELRDRFQSHTMKSYRSRFQRIYEICLGPEAPSPVFLMEHLPHLPHLRQWLGVNGTGVTEISEIAEPLSIKAATSLVPLGFGEKGSQPIKVDIHGYGLHLCTLVQAQVNGRWCSTKVESLPVPPVAQDPLLTPHEHDQVQSQDLQRLRVSIGAPLSPSAQVSVNSLPEECFAGTEAIVEGVEGLGQVIIYCSSDFKTSAKTVTMRLRRVRLLGMEGAGKTSLFYALMGQGRFPAMTGDGIFPDTEWREGASCGVNYVDAAGINLQDLQDEVEQLREELFADNSNKMDMVVLVHNLAHKIPRSRQLSEDRYRPALAVLLDEITAAGVPVALALTNKFAVSAERRRIASIAVMEAYKIRPDSTVVVNSCPYTVRGNSSDSLTEAAVKTQGTAQKFISAPINLVQMPFRRKEETLPVEGVKLLRELVHSILQSREEAAFEEMARIAIERQDNKKMPLGRPNPQVGAAIGAGLGVIAAIVTGAAAALRKP